MNKIFRVIWNHATQSWVAVSELTSAKGKTKSKTISKLAALSLVAGTALSMDAMAAYPDPVDTSVTSTLKANGNLAILTNNGGGINGKSATSSPKNVIYIGNGNLPGGIGDESVIIGNSVTGTATGYAADTLVGNRVRSGGGGQDSFGTAVGYAAQVSGPSVSIGVGTSSDIGSDRGWEAVKYSGVAIGAFSRVSGSANGGVAMGAISFADQTGSVAIGQLSGAATLLYDREVAGSGGGGKLYKTNEATGGNLVSIGAEAGARSTSSVAIGTQSTTSLGNDSIAMGTNSAAIKDNSIAIGHAAIAGGHTQADIDALDAKKMLLEADKANADKRLKEKTDAAEANPTAENKFQLSAAKAAVERLDLAIRRIDADLQRLSSATTRNATNAIAIGNQSQATDESALAFGNTARAKGVASIAQGKNTQATAENAIAVGTSSNVSGANSVALGANITKLTTENSVVLGANSTEVVGTTGASHAVQTVNDATVRTIAGPNFTYSGFVGKPADAGHYVSIGQAGKERQIKNLAAGAVTPTSTDAINGSQLYALMDRVENKQEPVVYTNAAGDKLVKVGDDFYKAGDLDPATGKPLAGKNPVPAGDVIASMNNAGNNTTTPMALANIANNLPKIDNANATVTMPDGETLQNVPEYLAKAPITAEEAAAIANGSSGNNAATVSDVLNAGWNLQNNGEAKDFVKPYDTVNFVDGKGTKAVVESDNETSNVTFNVDTVDMTSNPNGTVENPMGDNAKQLLDDLAAAKKAVADNPDDEAAKAKLKDAEDAVNKAGGNKIATAQNVANMINNSGFTLKADKTDGQNETADETLKKDGELIKPGSTVTMKAGKNMTVKHEKDGNITYATASNVTFDSVQFGENGPKITNKGGNINVGDKNGNPTQITGVASSLKTAPVETAPNGKDGAKPESKPNLVDLTNVTTPNAAATVGDLQNMGWVVGAPENGYVDTVKNANKVDFKGENGISVTGKTNKEGVREITISVAEGKVTNDVTVTKADGTVINGVKGPDGKLYEKGQDGKPDTSKPITLAEGDKVNNEGSKFVSGNAVATAIQESGWNIGKADAKDVTKAFEKEAKVHDKVNPNDDVKFVDGQNTVVKMVTVDAKNEDGSKKATTFVKVDVTGLPVQYTDKNGTPVTKVGDKYFTVDDKGNPTTTEVAPADLTTNMVNPAAKPNEIGAPTTLGNVKSNLPSVNDADKNAKDVDGKPIAGKDNKSAPIDAAKAADIAKNAGNNAATVSDVLNAGWNLQNNGKDKDFVKPYDTVNFVDGKGTKAVVKTEEDGTTSNVKFDIDTGSITNNADGSVQGPVVTPEMTKALEDATNTLNNLPANAPASVRKAAEQAVADAANNIANVANKVATAQDVANAINKSGFTLTTSANGGEKISGTPEMINPGKKVEMVAGKNMTVKQESNGKVTYATASNVTFDSVQFGDNGPKITNNGGNINVGTATGAPTKITGVAPGEISATSKDAVNGSQLHAMGNKLQGQINKLGNRMNAGMATSAAMANLLQPHKPGQSVATAGVGQHKNQSAVAVGYSRLSDNGKYGVRFSMGANTQGEVTGGAAVGYFW